MVFDKLARMWTTEPTHDLPELRALQAPTLVLLADDDVVTVEHAAGVAAAMPDAQLAVVPGTDHALIFEKPDLVNRKLFASRHGLE